MPHWEILWIEGEDGNIAHLAEHDITPEEAAYVIKHPIRHDISRTSDKLILMGYTKTGRKIAIVYEEIDKVTIYPITGYDVP